MRRLASTTVAGLIQTVPIPMRGNEEDKRPKVPDGGDKFPDPP